MESHTQKKVLSKCQCFQVRRSKNVMFTYMLKEEKAVFYILLTPEDLKLPTDANL